jgi:hypothetical protein
MNQNETYKVEPSYEGQEREIKKGLLIGGGALLAAGAGVLAAVTGIKGANEMAGMADAFQNYSSIQAQAGVFLNNLGSYLSNATLLAGSIATAGFAVLKPFKSWLRSKEVLSISEDGMHLVRPALLGKNVVDVQMDTIDRIKVKNLKEVPATEQFDAYEIGDVYVTGSVVKPDRYQRTKKFKNGNRRNRTFQIPGVRNPGKVEEKLGEILLSKNVGGIADLVSQ